MMSQTRRLPTALNLLLFDSPCPDRFRSLDSASPSGPTICTCCISLTSLIFYLNTYLRPDRPPGVQVSALEEDLDAAEKQSPKTETAPREAHVGQALSWSAVWSRPHPTPFKRQSSACFFLFFLFYLSPSLSFFFPPSRPLSLSMSLFP